ncbi:MAG: GNAT family N-acetyltransferase [Nostoc sp. DedQUE04]|uniref:GNAT family N-acetyltransferase n=1 Tax=Nostoc sp. DedQUE04 TaxID=3075390 RepID=UPI002AD39152|nr:GNAT family N-acetyltransferase [Nostoc sp. DedQUE04]MDZ8140884.1 GNAT family N-acetyltransferase [Nostoc sp. DedQUE04]
MAQIPEKYTRQGLYLSLQISSKSLCTKLQELTCLGKKVIKKIIQAAIDNHISKIYLDCVIDNLSLEKYYKRFGFERIVIVKHPKYYQDMVVMVLGV